MTLRTFLFLSLIVSVALPADESSARPSPKSSKRSTPQSFMRAANSKSNVQLFYTNRGVLFNNDNQPGLLWPRGSNNAYIFASGMWFGAIKNVKGVPTKVAEITYNPNSGAGWFREGEFSPASDGADSTKYYSYNSLDFSEAGFPLNADPGTPQHPWPLLNLSIDPVGMNYNFGQYLSDVGEREVALTQQGYRPVYLSEETIVNVYSDRDTNANPEYKAGRGYPLGLDVVETIYSWGYGPYRDMLFVRYRITNSSSDTLRDACIGFAIDPDIGAPGAAGGANDRAGFVSDSTLRPEFVQTAKRALNEVIYDEYQSLNELEMAFQSSEREGGKNLGMVGFTLVESPAISPTTREIIPNDAFMEMGGYGPNSQFAQSRLGLRAVRNWTIINDPSTNEKRYDFLATPKLDADSSPGDKRVMISTGLFNMLPGATATTTLGIVFAHASETQDHPTLDSLIKLTAMARRVFSNPIDLGDGTVILEHFQTPMFERVSSEREKLDIKLTQSGGSLEVELKKVEELSVELYDIRGAKLKHASSELGSVSVPTSDLPAGTYILRASSNGLAATRSIRVKR
jgi:hypothetical protein